MYIFCKNGISTLMPFMCFNILLIRYSLTNTHGNISQLLLGTGSGASPGSPERGNSSAVCGKLDHGKGGLRTFSM